MANNHALCYSLINESNPGTAKINKKEGIIISIKNIIPEALLASAPYDLCSDTRKPIPTTKRKQKFLTAKNMPNQTRDRYNEYDIEMQNKKAKNYQKIQPSSIICFETITKESLKAAQELQKKLNKTIPIELIDRKELAKNEMKKIQTALNNFKQNQEIDETLIKEIITRFQNVRNAHISSDISQEIIGENAPFNIKNLDKILKDCLNDITKNKKKSLKKLEAITKIIIEERQKPHLLETLEQKEKWIGISKEIDKELEKLKQNQQNQIETETKSKIKLAKLESTKEKLKIFKIELKTLETKPKKEQTTRR